jgi:hypothetical protein
MKDLLSDRVAAIPMNIIPAKAGNQLALDPGRSLPRAGYGVGVTTFYRFSIVERPIIRLSVSLCKGKKVIRSITKEDLTCPDGDVTENAPNFAIHSARGF